MLEVLGEVLGFVFDVLGKIAYYCADSFWE